MHVHDIWDFSWDIRGLKLYGFHMVLGIYICAASDGESRFIALKHEGLLRCGISTR